MMGLGLSEGEKDAYRYGAYWADAHPLFCDRIPADGDKTAGEVLSLTAKLASCSGGNRLMTALYEQVRDNVAANRGPFENIELP